MADGSDKPALITDAEPSHADQMRSRQIRYGVMMGIRALLLIIATVLVMVKVPLLWLWLTLSAIGMVLLPWMAVLIANDRPPKEEHRISRWRPGRRPKASGTPELTDKNPQVIDVDS